MADFLFEVGTTQILQGERETLLQRIFFAQRIADDHYESPIPGGYFCGTTPKELALKVRAHIDLEAGQNEREVSWSIQNLNDKRKGPMDGDMSHTEDTEFRNILSFAPRQYAMQLK
jgi:hypothetical protein